MQVTTPSGSSRTAALVYFTHKVTLVTELLEHNNYARCLMNDFTEAFHSVHRLIILCKLVQFDIPDFVVS